MKMSKLDDDFLGACQKGVIPEMDSLLQKGASIHGATGGGSLAWPLMSALLFRQWEAAHWLLDHGAHPIQGVKELDNAIEEISKDTDGRIALLVDRIVNAILKGEESLVDGDLSKAFYKACEHGHLELAQRIYRTFKTPETISFRHSPVGWAAVNGHHQTVKWLCEVGWDYRTHRSDELPPSVYAILGKSPQSLLALLASGESPSRTAAAHIARMICTPHLNDLPKNERLEIFHEGPLLHFTAIANCPECASVLIEAGADVHAKDSEGRTAAELALLGGAATREVLACLSSPDENVAFDADELFKQAVLQLSSENLSKAIQAGANLDVTMRYKTMGDARAMTVAACENAVEIVKQLIASGCDVDQVDGDPKVKMAIANLQFVVDEIGLETMLQYPSGLKRSPLVWAASKGALEVMEILVSHGADVSCTDALQMNALHAAASENRTKAIDWLLEHDFDVNSPSLFRFTPLHIATITRSYDAVVKLLERGTDPLAKTKRGETAYDLAKEYGHTSIRKELEKVTPKEKRKRERKPSKPVWEFDASVRKKIISSAKKEFGKKAKQLASEKMLLEMQQRAATSEADDAFQKIVKQLRGTPADCREETSFARCVQAKRKTDASLLKLQEQWLADRWLIVRGANTDDPTNYYVIPSEDIFTAMASFQLNACNHGIDSVELIAWLMSLHSRHPYRVIALRYDSVELQFNETPDAPDSLMDEVMMICPPEEFEDYYRKSLKKSLSKASPKLSLWWG
jgi:ankyrin repeat protein